MLNFILRGNTVMACSVDVPSRRLFTVITLQTDLPLYIPTHHLTDVTITERCTLGNSLYDATNPLNTHISKYTWYMNLSVTKLSLTEEVLMVIILAPSITVTRCSVVSYD